MVAQQLVVLSHDESQVFLQPAAYDREQHGILSVDDIYSLLTAYRVRDYYVSEPQLVDVLTSLLDENEKRANTPIIIAERRDAQSTIRIDEDAMTAFVTIVGGYGGKSITHRELIASLSAEGVVHGISNNHLDELLLRARKLQPGETLSDAVAFGTRPINGKDAQLKAMVRDCAQRVLRPRDRGDGTVDMRDLGDIIMVEAGTPVMKKTPATRGKDGINVKGRELKSNNGKDRNFKIGKGTVISPQNPLLLLSASSGIPHIKDNTVEIDEALCLSSVNVSTGHIIFDGSIVVNGDVSQGMRVKATGTVTVGGFIESASVEAGEDVVVANGIIGRRGEKLNCNVSAKGKISSKFAQYANLNADGDVHLFLHALHCHIHSKGNLVVSDSMGRKGTLNGGFVRVGGGIQVVNLGATASTPTTISAFENYERLIKQRRQFTTELKVQLDTMQRVLGAAKKIASLPAAKRSKETIVKLKQAKASLTTQLSRLQSSIDECNEELTQQSRQSTVTAINHVYPGVQCTVAGEALNILEEHGPSKLRFNGKTIDMQPI